MHVTVDAYERELGRWIEGQWLAFDVDNRDNMIAACGHALANTVDAIRKRGLDAREVTFAVKFTD